MLTPSTKAPVATAHTCTSPPLEEKATCAGGESGALCPQLPTQDAFPFSQDF